MKKSIQLAALTGFMLVSLCGGAQVSVNVNIGSQPVWGPVGYDYVQYYYLPDYDLYYDVPAHRYVYLDGGHWIFARALPSRYASVNLYSTYKVVINEPKAYLHYKEHKVKYVQYKGGGHNQVIIKNSNEPKYYVVKGHPHYTQPPGQSKKMEPGKHNAQPNGHNAAPRPSYQSRPSGGHGGGNGGKGGSHGGGHGHGKGG